MRVGITANAGPHRAQDTSAPPLSLARGGGLCPPRTSVGALLRAQGSLYPEKNCVKISAQSELRISRNIRNGFRPDRGEREIEKNREADTISEGLPPLHHHGGHGQEGELSSHLGGRPRKKEEGALSHSLPVALEHHRGKDRDGDLHQQFCYRQHQLSPPSMQWCNTSSPRCNLYLNMVLNAINLFL